MIKYKSQISITILNPRNLRSIQESLEQAAPTSKFSIQNGNLQVNATIQTVGSPDNEFLKIARLIWWENEEFCQVIFFVEHSELCYSSNAEFSRDDELPSTEKPFGNWPA